MDAFRLRRCCARSTHSAPPSSRVFTLVDRASVNAAPLATLSAHRLLRPQLTAQLMRFKHPHEEGGVLPHSLTEQEVDEWLNPEGPHGSEIMDQFRELDENADGILDVNETSQREPVRLNYEGVRPAIGLMQGASRRVGSAAEALAQRSGGTVGSRQAAWWVDVEIRRRFVGDSSEQSWQFMRGVATQPVGADADPPPRSDVGPRQGGLRARHLPDDRVRRDAHPHRRSGSRRPVEQARVCLL